MLGWLFDFFFVGLMIEVRRDNPAILWGLMGLLFLLGVCILAITFNIGGW